MTSVEEKGVATALNGGDTAAAAETFDASLSELRFKGLNTRARVLGLVKVFGDKAAAIGARLTANISG